MTETTVVILTPDTILDRLELTVLAIYEDAGLKILINKPHQLNPEEIRGLWPDIDEMAMSGYTLGLRGEVSKRLLIRGENAVEQVLALNEQIRKEMPCAGGPFMRARGSATLEAAMLEARLLFREQDLLEHFPPREPALAHQHK